MPPLRPMLAKAVDGVPDGPGLVYEPKWDGFRAIVFRDGGELVLGSRNERPLTRYFPELVDPLRAWLPDRCVVDGEIIVALDDRLDFDALGQRIHPAASRVERLAAETPAAFVAFDLLALDDHPLLSHPLTDRRRLLEAALASAEPPVHLTPQTPDVELARDWFDRFEGAGIEGIMAKPSDAPYVPDKRTQFKIKHRRTADCVIAGFRTHRNGGVGSLLLGLYDDDGRLHHVGVAASFTAARRQELVDEVAPLRVDADDDHPWRGWLEASAHRSDDGRMPGGPSRWNTGKDLSWEPLRPERVAEVAYERLDHGRFRHGSRLLRWRPDRTPASCRFDQLETVTAMGLSEVLAS